MSRYRLPYCHNWHGPLPGSDTRLKQLHGTVQLHRNVVGGVSDQIAQFILIIDGKIIGHPFRTAGNHQVVGMQEGIPVKIFLDIPAVVIRAQLFISGITPRLVQLTVLIPVFDQSGFRKLPVRSTYISGDIGRPVKKLFPVPNRPLSGIQTS